MTAHTLRNGRAARQMQQKGSASGCQKLTRTLTAPLFADVTRAGPSTISSPLHASSITTDMSPDTRRHERRGIAWRDAVTVPLDTIMTVTFSPAWLSPLGAAIANYLTAFRI